ncbi:MAG: DUF3750 domain-containing protein [Candidatus Rokuibacteriota bacterium]
MKRTSRVTWSALLALAVLAGCAVLERGDWRQARRDASGLAPSPESTREAVVQVYAARAVGWRAALAVHSWIVLKPRGAPAYTRYEVIGWGVERGLPAIRINRAGPDNYWFGSRPLLIVDRRGDDVGALIAKIEAAIASYPYPKSYRTWPGPNSNTFVAYVGRAVPELRLELPPTAIGKDFIPGGGLMAPTPSGRGVQLSLLGLAGVLVGWEEGLEVNVLGLTFGLDVKEPALKLPGLGRLGVP